MSYISGPVHTLADFQVEFNGLLMGNGTSYYLPPDGSWAFFDMAAIKTMDQTRTWADGSWSGPDFADVLLPGVNVHIDAADPTTFAGLVTQFLATIAPAAVGQPLWVKVPNIPAVGILAKPNKRVLPATNVWSVHAEGALQWRCTDPQWQSVPRTLNLAAAGAATSGLTFPLFTPASGPYTPPGALDFGSTTLTTSSGTLTNAGNTPAWPVVVVNGPCPSFSIVLDGNIVSYGQAVPAGQQVTVDYKSGTATLTGNVDRTPALTARNFTAVTKTSTILFSAASGTAAATIADIWR